MIISTVALQPWEKGPPWGGPVECPVCSYQGGGITAVVHDDFDNDDPFDEEWRIGMACSHGHEWVLIFANIDDSIGTFAWSVEVTKG